MKLKWTNKSTHNEVRFAAEFKPKNQSNAKYLLEIFNDNNLSDWIWEISFKLQIGDDSAILIRKDVFTPSGYSPLSRVKLMLLNWFGQIAMDAKDFEEVSK